MGKYSRYGDSGEYVDRINFDELVKLYVNHRPVFAVGPEQIRQAFQALKKHEPGRHLEQLTGDPSIHRALDEEVDALDFAHGVLGLSEEQDSGEAAGSVDGGKSQWDTSTLAVSSAQNASTMPA